MTTLQRTELTTSQKIECAAGALSRQGEYGAMTALSERYGVSRPTVYSAGATAQTVLEAHFEHRLLEGAALTVRVDDAQLRRALVGLRAMAPNSIRAIESLLPVLYPGVKVSYGKIQQLLVEAERRASAFNKQSALGGIEAGALDEMYSQGEPVLAGVDLDHGYLFALELSASRDGGAWARVLRAGQAQGLALQVVVKDAAMGIAAGVNEVFPQAEQRDDCFHALYELNKVRRRLERRAYGAIEAEHQAQLKLGRIRARDGQARDKQRRQWVWAGRQCAKAIEHFDRCERALEQVREALACVDLASGELRSAEQVQAHIESAARTLSEIGDRHSVKVARYLRNRAPGLALAMGALRPQLDALGEVHGPQAVRLGCIIWRLAQTLNTARCPKAQRQALSQHLLGAFAALRRRLGDETDGLLAAIRELLDHHHRASSAIEGFNAALRPYLYVHKGVTQGFLELFRAYFNLRTRRWGRHKGTSAQALLTGQPVNDWLTELGYPPSPALS